MCLACNDWMHNVMPPVSVTTCTLLKFNVLTLVFTGCDVSRLRDFITEFYAHPSPGQVHGQTVDDAFCAFVWSVIVQQPGVRVGTISAGGSTEVYIAPQASAIRKAKAKGEDAVDEPAPATGLDIIDDAAVRPLHDLREQYGDRLRMAVDPETTFAALTGSHIRVSNPGAVIML